MNTAPFFWLIAAVGFLVLEGCTGVCAEEDVTEEELDRVVKLFILLGRAYVVPERLMDVVVGVSGSSPPMFYVP